MENTFNDLPAFQPPENGELELNNNGYNPSSSRFLDESFQNPPESGSSQFQLEQSWGDLNAPSGGSMDSTYSSVGQRSSILQRGTFSQELSPFYAAATAMPQDLVGEGSSSPASSLSLGRMTRRKELFAGPAPSADRSTRASIEGDTSPSPSNLSYLDEIANYEGPTGHVSSNRPLKRPREDSLESEFVRGSDVQEQTFDQLPDDELPLGLSFDESTFTPPPDLKGKGMATAIDHKGKGKERAIDPDDSPIIIGESTSLSKTPTSQSAPTKPPPEPLSAYTCPICFSAPTNATLTPCGHICCGECLFTAVKTTMQRSALAGADDANDARCPVCRAVIQGWDGTGGGVIGLKPRAIFSL